MRNDFPLGADGFRLKNQLLTGKLKITRACIVVTSETHLPLPFSRMWILHGTLNSTETMTPRLRNNILEIQNFKNSLQFSNGEATRV